MISNKAGEKIASGPTPYTVALKRSRGYFQGEDYLVTVSKFGFQDQTLQINSSVNGWYIAGNLVFGGVFGWLIVDPLTGAMWTLDPDTLNATLPANAHADNADGTTLNVVLLENVPADVLAFASPVMK